MTFALSRHLLESTVFGLAIGLVVFLSRKRGATTRHALWFLAAIKFAVPAGLLSTLGASLQGLFSTTQLSMIVPRSFSPLLTLQKISRAPTAPGNGLSVPILIWLIGSAAMLAVWLPKLFTAGHSLESHGDFDEASFLRLKQRLGLRRNVRLRFADSNAEPVLLGFWKPVVVISQGLSTRLSTAELEAVILHELAHTKRWDNWTGALVHAIACVFWFHPLLWWIEWRLLRERELACDEMVVRHGAAPEEYVAGILKVCRFHLGENIAGISSVSGSNLTKRMELIMSLSTCTPRPRLPKFLIGTLIATVTIIPMVLGLMAVPSVYGQAATSATHSPNHSVPLTCISADVQYPEGTVIQEAGGPEQMCAKVMKGGLDEAGRPVLKAQWIHTSDEIRERSRKVIHIPQPPPVVCTPEPATEARMCFCQGHTSFSPGAEVDSLNGKLHCEEGQWWMPAADAHAEKK